MPSRLRLDRLRTRVEDMRVGDFDDVALVSASGSTLSCMAGDVCVASRSGPSSSRDFTRLVFFVFATGPVLHVQASA